MFSLLLHIYEKIVLLDSAEKNNFFVFKYVFYHFMNEIKKMH